MFKSHIGLHRFDPWAKSSKGEYSHLVAKQIWVHHLESLKDFNFTTHLLGNVFTDSVLGSVLQCDVCSCSTTLQHDGKKFSQNDVLLGKHPGRVICAVRSGNNFLVETPGLEIGERL